jgi:26S proteasome regulatory complex component
LRTMTGGRRRRRRIKKRRRKRMKKGEKEKVEKKKKEEEEEGRVEGEGREGERKMERWNKIEENLKVQQKKSPNSEAERTL